MTFLTKEVQTLLNHASEGIHIVDKQGVTLYYNPAMEMIEGFASEMVVGKHLLDIFPSWSDESSTMLTVLQTGNPILNREQKYLNRRGRMIHTINSTYPLYKDDELVGAVEYSKDMTVVSELTDQLINLKSQWNDEELLPKKGQRAHYKFDEIIGKSVLLSEALAMAKKAAKSSSSVLIYGDTGTGKEMIAQSIHFEGHRHQKPFIAQNCAAIPEALLEGLLFGTVKGAFTGAENRMGLFEQANRGTLFLDEINSMSMPLQAKILRVIQESYVRRLGGDRDIPIDVRIIASSNEDPAKSVLAGRLRKDLYYRINVIAISVPRLSERKEDIPLLCDHLLRTLSQEMKKEVWMISDDVSAMFQQYTWPGNIRELRNFLESAMNQMGDERVIRKEHLPQLFLHALDQAEPLVLSTGLTAEMAAYEKQLILNSYDGTLTNTAKRLGISRQLLRYKLNKYHITS